MKRRILITGANGFIGKHLVSKLTQKDLELVLVVRSSDEVLESALHGGAHVVTTSDLFAEDESWWRETTRDVDTFVHAAWYTKHPDYMTSDQNQTCENGTIRIAEALRNSRVRRFVGLGTCLEYHQTGELLTTDSELRPESPYATAKSNTFLRLSEIFEEATIEFAWCRLFYIHGPGEHESRLVPILRRELSRGNVVKLQNPRQVLDFLEVHDVIQKLEQVVLGGSTGALNICSGIATTVSELSMAIASDFGHPELIDSESSAKVEVSPPIVGQPSL